MITLNDILTKYEKTNYTGFFAKYIEDTILLQFDYTKFCVLGVINLPMWSKDNFESLLTKETAELKSSLVSLYSEFFTSIHSLLFETIRKTVSIRSKQISYYIERRLNQVTILYILKFCVLF
jgi:hypothetical protein